jgi:hypothetical protein
MLNTVTEYICHYKLLVEYWLKKITKVVKNFEPTNLYIINNGVYL